eukprot:CAMPEP_0119007084 /NCGR_PEP_ID=MMETSP1176-20130426/2758_1 /TAXON_ID=265551 /ORGANISM="Synedropsis recta cf, Strain CCMP1620" /LENGTH=309 /DNA_ID=CAMNT_0006959153 /DNA_START=40 /DNA_END=969 /DNA_ORIENTATION=-
MTRLLSLPLLLLLLYPGVTVVEAAHSRRRPVVRSNGQQPKYDRAITTFSADGRLQQVEYGMEAANRGDTIVAAKINQTLAIVMIPTTTTSSSSQKIHRIDAHILMATAGLAGDGRTLASAVRSSCQQHVLSYGERPTVHEAAQMAAQIQHDLTKTAGARPLGCSAILVGVDANDDDANDGVLGEVQIYHTDPGGVLEHCHYCVAGKKKDPILSGVADSFEEAARRDGSSSLAFHVASKTLGLLWKENDDDNDTDDSGKKKQCCDVWLVRAISGNDKKKGGMGLICARAVDEEQLSLSSTTTTRLSSLLR